LSIFPEKGKTTGEKFLFQYINPDIEKVVHGEKQWWRVYNRRDRSVFS